MINNLSSSNKLDFVKKWIENLINSHQINRISILDFDFGTLPKFHSEKDLLDKYVILVDKCPMLPLDKLGLTDVSEMQIRKFKGITYSNYYFIVKEEKYNESLHFHELVHTFQWEYFGVDKFLKQYAYEISRFGYVGTPLEKMAYRLQEKFDNKHLPFNVKLKVYNELKSFKPNY